MDKILKVAKKLKTFTLEDIVMFCDIDETSAVEILQQSENIQQSYDKFEYIETVISENKFKIIDKNIPSKNLDITVIEACEEFLRIKHKILKQCHIRLIRLLLMHRLFHILENSISKT